MARYNDLSTIDGNKIIDFLGIRINNLTMEEIVDHVEYCIKRKKPCHFVGLNIDQALRVIENDYSHSIFSKAEVVYVDGQPIVWMSRLLNRTIKERVPGPDLMLRLCKQAKLKKYKVFLLGALPGVASQAAKNLSKAYPGINIVGSYSPPLGFEKNEEEIRRIVAMLRESEADLLFVGMGSPKQDYFIYENMMDYSIPVSFSMGAAIDFVGGKRKRAPKWIQNCGFEWFYRFIREPKRLFRRYFVDGPRIFLYYFSYIKSEKKAGRL